MALAVAAKVRGDDGVALRQAVHHPREQGARERVAVDEQQGAALAGLGVEDACTAVLEVFTLALAGLGQVQRTVSGGRWRRALGRRAALLSLGHGRSGRNSRARDGRIDKQAAVQGRHSRSPEGSRILRIGDHRGSVVRAALDDRVPPSDARARSRRRSASSACPSRKALGSVP